ncbi:rhomboid family intramembrane serine protease [Ideonella sp.]|uniref:rhomboid family intramembrane serine protease n=1 Tax=Ideonella sp. TaxID=1929293 RepID=UPI003BB6FD60
MPLIPPVTQALMLLCTAVFCLQWLVPITPWFALYSLDSGRFMPWQPLTFALIHQDTLQLFFNMLALWMFGAEMESLWGAKRYLQFLVACVLAAALTALVVMLLGGGVATASGASAAIYGLLFATAMLNPNRTIMPLFPPIPMKARTFVIVFVALILITNISLTRQFVEAAMLGGMVGAWVMLLHWRGRAPWSPKRKGW